jgi:hypothetical protein
MVSLTGYTFKSDGTHGSSWHLLQWKIEGSANGTDWEKIDARITRDLNGSFVTKVFTCSQVGDPRFYRYIRITQTGKNSGGTDHFMLCNVEFFGTLRSPDPLD